MSSKAKHRAVPVPQLESYVKMPAHHSADWWMQEQSQLLHAFTATHNRPKIMTSKGIAKILAEESRKRGFKGYSQTLRWFIKNYIKEV